MHAATALCKPYVAAQALRPISLFKQEAPMPDADSRLHDARRALDQALTGLAPYPETVRRAFEELVAAKVHAMAEQAARELEERTRDHNRPTGA